MCNRSIILMKRLKLESIVFLLALTFCNYVSCKEAINLSGTVNFPRRSDIGMIPSHAIIVNLTEKNANNA